MKRKEQANWALVLICLLCLLLVYMFQDIDVAGRFLMIKDRVMVFVINRLVRFLINDGLAISLIYGLFREKRFVIFSFWIQAIGMVFILFPYLALKVKYPDYNGPFVSFLHRLIVNPTLLLLLIPAFYYQQRMDSQGS